MGAGSDGDGGKGRQKGSTRRAIGRAVSLRMAMRKCPACQRKGAMKKSVLAGWGTVYQCRYCKFEKGGGEMSSSTSKPVKYECANDCEQGGCPGHEVVCTFSRTSDTISFAFDGKDHEVFDENRFHAMMKAYDSIE